MPKPSLKVFFNHQLVAEHPPELWPYLGRDVADLLPPGGSPDDLVVVEHGKGGVKHLVAHYPAGTWHSAGHGIFCGWETDDPNCPTCHPSTPATS